MSQTEKSNEFIFRFFSDTIERLESVVALIRADKKIGRGSCSSVDECLTDDELIQQYIEWIVMEYKGAPKRFVAFMREVDGIQRDRAEDIRNA